MIKKYIIALLFVGALHAQQDGPGNYDELKKAIITTDSEQAKLEIAWQFHKLTPEEREHLIEVAQQAAQQKQDEVSYKYLYRDWKKIGTTTSVLYGAYRAGKYAYDRSMEVKSSTDAGVPLGGSQMIKAVSAVYSAEVAVVLAINGGIALYYILSMRSAKTEQYKAQALVRELKKKSQEQNKNSESEE